MPGAKDRDDGESNAMLYDGFSISQLARAFNMDARDVSKKLRDTPPSGERRGFPIWKLKEAAASLVPPRVSEEQILAYIAGMNFKDLPAALNKEVWNGLRARLRFEQEQGDLWKTDRVLEIVNKLMQTFRMGALMLGDKVNRIDTLTTRQREAIERLMDEVLDDMQQQVIAAMADAPEMTSGIMDYTDGSEEPAEPDEPDNAEAADDFDDL